MSLRDSISTLALIVAVVAVGVVACRSDPVDEAKQAELKEKSKIPVKFSESADGCTVYRFLTEGGMAAYFTRCQGESVESLSPRKVCTSGKSGSCSTVYDHITTESK